MILLLGVFKAIAQKVASPHGRFAHHKDCPIRFIVDTHTQYVIIRSMELTFIQLSGFANKWRKIRLSDEDLQALERQLRDNPEAGDVIRGTSGLRKVRFAPPSRHTGKSGAFRVAYGYFRVASTIYLFVIFA